MVAKSDTHADDRPVEIACAGVTKVFRDFWMRPRVRAVEDVDLKVHRGQIFGLLGPNGSGKSTTIKMLLGLLQPSAGRIAVLGKRPTDVETKRLIGYLPEESYLYRFLSGRETLEYYGRLFRLERRTRAERIDMLLDMVGLDVVQDRPVGEYSKGMQRRIGLAQALINDPQLLILDEPTSGMDPVGAKQIKDVIALLAQRGKTVLLCSHLLADVEDLCDRVAIMYGGKIRVEGTCSELLESEHATLIETSEMSEPVTRALRGWLDERSVQITKIERPRRRLESLFLEIVEKARSEGVQTAGARSGGRVAEFLEKPTPSGADPAMHAETAAASDAVDTDLLGSLVAPPARQAADRGPEEA
jgi:ABC-2 type transport system ATP-binding protein